MDLAMGMRITHVDSWNYRYEIFPDQGERDEHFVDLGPNAISYPFDC